MVHRQGKRNVRDETYRWQLREAARARIRNDGGGVPVAVSPTGSVVVTSYLHNAWGYRLTDLSLAWELASSARIYPSQNPSFSGSEMVLGLGSTVTFYRVEEDRAPVRARSFLVPVLIDRCVVSPDSRRMAIYDNHRQKLTLYDCAGKKFPIPLPRLPLQTSAGGFAGLAFDPASRWLVYAGNDGQALVVVDRNGRPVAKVRAPERLSTLYTGHRSLEFTACGEGLLLGCYTGIEQLDWQRATSVLLVGKGHWVGGLAPSPDGRLLAVTDQNGLVIYRLDGEEVACLAESPLKAFALQFTPDSSRLVVGTQDSGELIVLELVERSAAARPREEGPTWKQVDEFSWQSPSVTWERFDSDAADPGYRTSTVTPELTLTSRGGDRWALADGWNDVRVVGPGGAVLESVAIPAEGDRLHYEAVALSPSGRRLAVARRHSLFLWDLESSRHEARTGYSAYYKDRTHALRFASDDELWWASTNGLHRVTFAGHPRRDSTVDSPDGAWLEASYGLFIVHRSLLCHDLAELGLRWRQPLGDKEIAVATSPGRVALMRSGTGQVLQASDGAPLLQRELLAVPRRLVAMGFLGDEWLLVQWEDRTQLWDLQADRVYYPRIPGRLVACAQEAALVLQEDRLRILVVHS